MEENNNSNKFNTSDLFGKLTPTNLEERATDDVFLFGKVYSKKLLAIIIIACLLIVAVSAFFLFTTPQETTYERVSIAPGEQFDFAIITNYAALSKKYGENYANGVMQKATELAKTVESTEKIHSGVILLDDAAHASKYRFANIGSSFEREVARSSLEQAITATNASYVLIIGNDDVVPFRRMQNPLANDPDGAFEFIVQEDAQIYSDQYKTIAIGRLIDGNGGKANLTGMLDNAISLHVRSVTSGINFGKVVSNDSYGKFLAQVPIQVSNQNEPKVSPPLVVFNFLDLAFDPFAKEQVFKEIENSNTNLIFIALHGNQGGQSQALSGHLSFDSNEYLAMNAPLAATYNYYGKLFIVDSCYGANPDRLATGSIPITFLERGALGFVGSTSTALSNRKLFELDKATEQDFTQAGAASSLTFFTMKDVTNGERIGDALQNSRKKLDLSQPVNQLTYYQFQLYGDPTLKLR